MSGPVSGLIEAIAPPTGSLLARELTPGGYADSWITVIDRAVSLPEFIVAFWTTPVFRAERVVLAALGWPSTEVDARALGAGASERFAAWRVSARREQEILLHDTSGRTCSWFQVEALDRTGTRLWFGSSITAVSAGEGSAPDIGRGFRMMLGAHRLYSRVLLAQAYRRLAAR